MDGYSWPEIRTEWVRGWPVVMAGAIALGVGTSLYGYVSSLFVNALSQDLGWSRAQASLAIAMFAVSALAMPFVGILLQRYHVRSVSGMSFVGLAAAYIVLARSPPNIFLYHALFLLAMLAGGATGPLAVSYLINQWFAKGRGMALALALSGASLVPVLVASVMGKVIEAHGWRGGFFSLAALALTVGLPAVLMGFRDRPSSQRDEPLTSTAFGQTLSEAYRNPRLWLLCLTTFLVATPISGVANQLQSLGLDRGLDRTTAAGLVSAFAAGVLIGRLVTGFLIDRFWAPAVGAAVLLIAAAGFASLTFGYGSAVLLMLSVGLIGMAQGAELDLMALLTARYFGLRSYGAIYGLVMIAFALALPIGALSFSMARDAFGTLELPFRAAAATLCLSALLLLLMGPCPEPVSETR